jgi:hypothetical protein
MKEINDTEKHINTVDYAHLSDEELRDYHDGGLDSSKHRRFTSHLNMCLLCSRKYDLMKNVLQSGKDCRSDRIILDKAALIGKIIFSFNAWSSASKHNIRMGSAIAFSTPESESDENRLCGSETHEGQTEDGSVFWRYIATQDGDHEIRFSSNHLKLVDTVLTFKAGPITKTAKLSLFPGKPYVYGRVSFTAQEWETIPPNSRIELINKK